MAELGSLLPVEQPVNLVFDKAVALADVRLEPIAIENGDTTTTVTNQPGILQVPCGYRHALTASTDHIRDEFLGHEQIGAIFPVVTHEQPTAEPLFHGMQTVTRSGLRNLCEVRLCVAQKQMSKMAIVCEFFL